MATHVKVLAVLYLVLSGLFVLGALLLMVVVGGAVTAVGTAAASDDAAIALPIIGVTGMTLVIFLLALAIPGLLTGWGLLNFRPWARILGIVLSAINLLNVPIGTALGLYGLWVLLSKETEAFFLNTRGIPPPTI
ncbi:MAG: hypothetical protein H0T05_02375 [Acidobacteria bacterium]|nr:hypothetical protein [Acidobacteriota bacterium]MBA3888245.1 hypothetical protein [Acidobacteriota bacterium]